MRVLKSLLLAGAVLLPLAVSAQAADVADVPSDIETSQLGLYLRGDFGWSMLDWQGGDNDNAWTGGAGLGYQFNENFRADITGNYTGDYAIAPGADISTASVLGNVYFDWANDSMLTPYVGVGAGYGWVNGSGLAVDDSGLALAATAGVAIDITDNLALDAGYKFQDIMVSGDDVMEHQATIGFRFKF